MTSSYLHFPDFDPVIFNRTRRASLVRLNVFGGVYFRDVAGDAPRESSGQWLDQNEVENLLYAGFLGVFLGGRIGYVLFYNFPLFLDNPCICSASGTAVCPSTVDLSV